MIERDQRRPSRSTQRRAWVPRDSLSDYASNSVSWLQGQNQTGDRRRQLSELARLAGDAALSNATGVNLDTEMTNMLNIENSYTTSAKLLTTVNAMFSALINAA